MRSIQIPVGFQPATTSETDSTFTASNSTGSILKVHFVEDGLARVVFSPKTADASGGSQLEVPRLSQPLNKSKNASITALSTPLLSMNCDLSGSPRLSWSRKTAQQEAASPFMQDCISRAYSFDAISGAVNHYVERDLWLPRYEEEPRTGEEVAILSHLKDEYAYGLGETTGSLAKECRRYSLEPRDSLGYDPRSGDGLYKFSSFYVVHQRSQNLWYGVFYNTRSACSFNMGSETDALFGSFRSFSADSGPLDYYVILADGTLPSIVSTYAKLITPTSPQSAPGLKGRWASSPTLPPLSQFGYLSSSLGLAARHDAQPAIYEFIETCRNKGFPMDGLHLSSGWCQDEVTDFRNAFAWNLKRYPDPAIFGKLIEGPLAIPADRKGTSTSPLGAVVIIPNVKPWVLDQHPMRNELGNSAFVQNAVGGTPEKSLLWSKGLGDHAPGSYLDFSSTEGFSWWKKKVVKEVLGKSINGLWIDNNEFSGLIDDLATYNGDVQPYAIPGSTELGEVGQRMGWKKGPYSTVGHVGRVPQTMGMAKASYEAFLETHPNQRPVIVSRSAAPGMQVYAHGSWSGDNITSWASLRASTAMTLSVGLSFGTGLYGHDIGGFAPDYLSPSPELLLRWVQHGAWHTRFVVHSWKKVDTTLWMYDDVVLEGVNVGQALRDVVKMRYLLLPTFYSLYVAHYHRLAWPVLKPMIWHHSIDTTVMTLEDQFIFGSHVLIAPIVEKGSRTKKVYLPSQANGVEGLISWCELDTGKWHEPSATGSGAFVDVAAPLNRTPTFVRAGGILVLGGECKNYVMDGRATRTALLFPAPASGGNSDGNSDSFTLIEDDGVSNGHTVQGAFTELRLSFHADTISVTVDYEVIHTGGYQPPYDVMEVRLPAGDGRKIVAAGGKTLKDGKYLEISI